MTKMTKEEVLELLKHLILILRDQKEKLNDARLMADWVAKYKHLCKEHEKLSSCDILWVGDEYDKWYKKEIKPFISKDLLDLLPKI